MCITLSFYAGSRLVNAPLVWNLFQGIAYLALLTGCSYPQAAAPSPVLYTAVASASAPISSLTHTHAPFPSPSPTATTAVPTAQPLINTPTLTFTPRPSPTAVFIICSPLEGDGLEELYQIISDPYHPPPKGSDERHQGIDLSYFRRKGRDSIQGVTVQSVLAGWVAARVSGSFPFGNLLMIETPGERLPAELALDLGLGAGESLYVFYAHMENLPDLQVGDAVSACQPLGMVGKSGNAGVAHLHLETRLGPAGQTFLSMGYYQISNTPEERENYRLWRTSGVFRHFDPMRLLLFGLQL